jgi:RNA polymerase sigma factor (sigma-70 family)
MDGRKRAKELKEPKSTEAYVPQNDQFGSWLSSAMQMLTGYCINRELASSDQDACDLVYESCLRICKHIQRLDERERTDFLANDSRAHSWLRSVARNLAHRRWQRKKLEQRHLDFLRLIAQDRNSKPQKISISHNEIEDVLSFLSDRDRTIASMVMAGFCQTEIAAVLNIDRTTVRRALDKIGVRLVDPDPDSVERIRSQTKSRKLFGVAPQSKAASDPICNAVCF